MLPRHWVVLLLLVALLTAAAFRIGYDLSPELYASSDAQALIPPLPIPSVIEIAPTGDVADVVAYWDAHEVELVTLFRDEARAKALFVMYSTHIAIPYGESPAANTLAEYVMLQRAHCGIYTPVQAQLSRALGLTVREVAFVNGWHGWTEILIDGHYEIFDSTVNLWVSQPMEALLRGEPRQYRAYYTPISDLNAPDVFRAHLAEGYDVPALRARLAFVGLEPGTSYPEFRILPS